jgi:hypothetical protein
MKIPQIYAHCKSDLISAALVEIALSPAADQRDRQAPQSLVLAATFVALKKGVTASLLCTSTYVNKK